MGNSVVGNICFPAEKLETEYAVIVHVYELGPKGGFGSVMKGFGMVFTTLEQRFALWRLLPRVEPNTVKQTASSMHLAAPTALVLVFGFKFQNVIMIASTLNATLWEASD